MRPEPSKNSSWFAPSSKARSQRQIIGAAPSLLISSACSPWRRTLFSQPPFRSRCDSGRTRRITPMCSGAGSSAFGGRARPLRPPLPMLPGAPTNRSNVPLLTSSRRCGMCATPSCLL